MRQATERIDWLTLLSFGNVHYQCWCVSKKIQLGVDVIKRQRNTNDDDHECDDPHWPNWQGIAATFDDQINNQRRL
ncbi:MAG: hypothetical protein ACI85V_002556 [bacterium]|jgi:hypothetical protein